MSLVDKTPLISLGCFGPTGITFNAIVKDNIALVVAFDYTKPGPQPIPVDIWSQEANYCPGGSLEAFMRQAGDNARLGWVRAEGMGYEADIIHFYDATKPDDDEDSQAGLTWAMNLNYPDDSELGHAPFPHIGQSAAEYDAEAEEGLRRLRDLFGGDIEEIVVTHAVESVDPHEELRR